MDTFGFQQSYPYESPIMPEQQSFTGLLEAQFDPGYSDFQTNRVSQHPTSFYREDSLAATYQENFMPQHPTSFYIILSRRLSSCNIPRKCHATAVLLSLQHARAHQP
jgi:hypothetical protein